MWRKPNEKKTHNPGLPPAFLPSPVHGLPKRIQTKRDAVQLCERGQPHHSQCGGAGASFCKWKVGPVLDRHFTVDFVPGSTSAQVRFSESFSVRFEPERAKDRSICLSFDGDDFRAVEGPGLQNVEYTRSTVEATGENMQYEVGISTGTRTYLEVTGSGESRVRYERQGTVCHHD